jgi:caa(3)-type oxidase subunit IV
MAQAHAPASSSLYWKIWGILLVLTVVMVFVDGASLPFAMLAGILVAAMLVKAGLIASFFMHLRYEGILLILSVVLGLAVLGFILYALMIPDGLRIFDMVSEGS